MKSFPVRRNAVPAAKSYTCRICKMDLVLTKEPKSCPRCHTDGSVIERAIVLPSAVLIQNSSSKDRPVVQPQALPTPSSPEADPDEDDIDATVVEDRQLTMLSATDADEFERYTSHIRALDRVLDGGLVVGGVVVLAGEKGAGKTTLSTQVAMHHVLKNEDTRVFLASGEEALGRFKARLVRLGYTDKQIKIASKRIGGCRLKNIEAVHDEAAKLNPTMILYDSMPKKFLHPDVKSRKTEMHAPLVMDEIVDFCSAYSCTGIVVARLTQEGKVQGGEDWLYDTDGAILRLNRVYKPTRPPTKTRFRSLTCDKSVIGWMKSISRGLVSTKKPSFARSR
jgi:predicted ATP-dependent serine protease